MHEDKINSDGSIHVVHLLYSFGTGGMEKGLATVIEKSKPDIVHTRNWGGLDGVIAAILAGINYSQFYLTSYYILRLSLFKIEYLLQKAIRGHLKCSIYCSW